MPVEWSDIGPPEWRARRLILTLTPGFRHTIRLIHRPVKFWRSVGVDGRSRIISTESAQKVAGDVPRALCRYAVNVIDRADQQVKVLEGPERLFMELRRCHELTGVELGGADAFDINIEVSAAATYRISYDAEQRTPFTPREKEAIRMGMIDLRTVFAVSSVATPT